MKHAGPAALAALAPLLMRLRALPGLAERSPGCFYRKGRSFLHFHEDPTGAHADLRLEGAGFARLRAESPGEQDALVAAVVSALAAGHRGAPGVVQR